MASWKKVLVSGSSIEVAAITASAVPTGTTENVILVDGSGRFKQITQGALSSALGVYNFTASADTGTSAGIDSGNIFRVSGGDGMSTSFAKSTTTGSVTVTLNTGSTHFLSGVSKEVFEAGNFVDSSEIDFTVTTGASVTAVLINGSIANARLANSTISGIALGGTLAALTAGSGLTSAGTYTGATARTFAVDSGSMLPFYSSSILNRISGDITVNGNTGVAAIGSAKVTNAMLVNSAVTVTAGAGLITGGSVSLGGSVTLNAGAGTGIAVNADDIALKNAGSLTANLLTKWDSANGQLVNSSITDVGGIVTVAAGLEVGAPTGVASAGQIVTQAGIFVESGGVNVTGNSTFVNNVTVNGDLTVNGTTTTLNTTNLLVSDKFALFASGSDASTDGGIIVQQGATTGYALGVDASADRWALQNNLGHTATSITPDSYLVSAVGAAGGPSAAPVYGGASFGYGNIHVNTSTGEIFIYS
jgi:hypothetical protein